MSTTELHPRTGGEPDEIILHHEGALRQEEMKQAGDGADKKLMRAKSKKS